MENQLNPPPDEINLKSGKCMWIIDGFKIWAVNYEHALECYSLIKD
jgi:hypothetical protein